MLSSDSGRAGQGKKQACHGFSACRCGGDGQEQQEDNSDRYTLTLLDRDDNHRFGIHAHRFDVRISQEWLDTLHLLQVEASITQMLDHMIQDIVERVGGRPHDVIGIRLDHPSLDVAIHIPLRRVDEVRSSQILEAIERVAQSKKGLDIRSPGLNIRILLVRRRGQGDGGGMRLRQAGTIENFLRHKRTIVQVPDGMCFGRSVTVGLYWLEHGGNTGEWKRLVRNTDDCQTIRTREFYKTSGVTEGTCTGIDTWRACQSFSKDKARLVIHEVRPLTGLSLLYRGPPLDNIPTLHLLYSNESHYDFVKSVTALYGRNYYCDRCDKPYCHRDEHACQGQQRQCPKCQGPQHPRAASAALRLGRNCYRCDGWFVTQECYCNHLANDLCENMAHCKKCACSFDRRDGHACDESRHSCFRCGEELGPEHKCHVTPLSHNESFPDDAQFIFYDFESYVDPTSGEHVPNLCVMQLVCGKCCHLTNTNDCPDCPWLRDPFYQSSEKEIVFEGENVVERVADFVMTLAGADIAPNERRVRDRTLKTSKMNAAGSEDPDSIDINVYALAHNARSYDLLLLLKALVTRTTVPLEEPIKRGEKVLHVSLGRVVFKDSLSFIPIPLKGFSKAFGIEDLSKGYFPYLFNTPENRNCVAPLHPSSRFYDPDNMTAPERDTFFQWYQKNKRKPFDFQAELLRYCRDDVSLLRRGCGLFRRLFLEVGDVDPFAECITLPMACMKTFRRLFLADDQSIAIIPPEGYSRRDECKQTSFIANEWLDSLEHFDGVSLRRGVRAYVLDGFHEATRMGYEFLGCYWHGCPDCYSGHGDETLVNYGSGTTMKARYERTMFRLNALRRSLKGVVVMWECEYRRYLRKKGGEMKQFSDRWRRTHVSPGIRPRDAFFGGRTNGIRLYHRAQPGKPIKYVDVCSLYPYISKYGRFPVSDPAVVDSPPVTRLFELHGLIKCKVLPPDNLYHPLLPYRFNEKLYFPLCRSCAEESDDSRDCHHSARERAWVATYVSLELHEAVARFGYKVLEIYQAWHFAKFSQYDPEKQEGGLFTEYVNTFYALKQEASGYPKHCSPEDFLESMSVKEGIHLDSNNVKKNPGQRFLAKFCLNSHWGKFSQRNLAEKTRLVTEVYKFQELLENPYIALKDVELIAPEMVLVNYELQQEQLEPHGVSNPVIAAWVTAQARLKLYETVHRLGERCLYFDTDSVIYVHDSEGYNPELGSTLGQWTDEIEEGNHIQEFVTCGPKQYAYVLHHPPKDKSPQTVCKIRGMTLSYRVSHSLNFTTLKRIARESEHRHDRIEIGYKRIRPIGLRRGGGVCSRDEVKTYKMVCNKRRLVPDPVSGELIHSLPYGYKKPRKSCSP